MRRSLGKPLAILTVLVFTGVGSLVMAAPSIPVDVTNTAKVTVTNTVPVTGTVNVPRPTVPAATGVTPGVPMVGSVTVEE